MTKAFGLASRPNGQQANSGRHGWRRITLSSVLNVAADIVPIDPSGSYPNLGIYSFGRGVFEKPAIDGARTSASVLNRVSAGQFIYSRLFAFEGAYAFVPPEFDGYYVSSEFPTFDTDPEYLDARWLATYLRSPDRWAELAATSKGLGVRRQRVPVDAVLSYEVWLPDVKQQVAMVRAIECLDHARRACSAAEIRIASLVPATLNAAFGSLT
jgi:type I restriction enzyme, S subunit